MEIWENLIWPGNLALKPGPIGPGNLGQSGLKLWNNMAWKIGQILRGYLGRFGPEIQANVGQCALEI